MTRARAWRTPSVPALFPERRLVYLSRPFWVIAWAAAGAGVVVQLLRQGGVGALDSVWAEDGSIFLQEAINSAPLESIRTSYAGYVHAIPRLLAELIVQAPPSWFAVLLSVSAATVTALLALLVFRITETHFRSVWLRVILSAWMLFLPIAIPESLNNISTIQFCLLYASFWVVLWRTKKPWELALGSTVILLACLSSVLMIVLAPLVALRAVALRGRDRILLYPYVIGTALQLAVVFTVGKAGERFEEPLRNPASLAAHYSFSVVAKSVFGDRLTGSDPFSVRSFLLIGLAILLITLTVAVPIVKGVVTRKPVVLVAAVYSVAFHVVPVAIEGSPPHRYAIAPALLLMAAVAGAVERPDSGYGHKAWVRLRAVAVLWLVALALVDFSPSNRRSVGPRWSTALAQAEQACDEPGRRRAALRVAPGNYQLELPCGLIDDGKRPARGRPPRPLAFRGSGATRDSKVGSSEEGGGQSPG